MRPAGVLPTGGFAVSFAGFMRPPVVTYSSYGLLGQVNLTLDPTATTCQTQAEVDPRHAPGPGTRGADAGWLRRPRRRRPSIRRRAAHVPPRAGWRRWW